MNIQESTLVFKIVDENQQLNLDMKSDIKHFIADLSGVSIEVAKSITNKLITFGNSISGSEGSFVIVSEVLFDETLTIVPTLQEAYDYIEMEEIERQLKI